MSMIFNSTPNTTTNINLNTNNTSSSNVSSTSTSPFNFHDFSIEISNINNQTLKSSSSPRGSTRLDNYNNYNNNNNGKSNHKAQPPPSSPSSQSKYLGDELKVNNPRRRRSSVTRQIESITNNSSKESSSTTTKESPKSSRPHTSHLDYLLKYQKSNSKLLSRQSSSLVVTTTDSGGNGITSGNGNSGGLLVKQESNQSIITLQVPPLPITITQQEIPLINGKEEQKNEVTKHVLNNEEEDDDNCTSSSQISILNYLQQKTNLNTFNSSNTSNNLIQFIDRLNLSYLKLCQIPFDLSLFSGLIELNLSHNHLTCQQQQQYNIHSTNHSTTNHSHSTNSTNSTNNSSSSMVGFNCLSIISSSCKQLINLDLSFNRINNIMGIIELCNLKKLVSLNISNNPIRFVDNRIAILQKLLHFKPIQLLKKNLTKNGINDKYMIHTKSSIKKDASLFKTNPIYETQLTLNKVKKKNSTNTNSTTRNSNTSSTSSIVKQQQQHGNHNNNNHHLDMSPFIQSMNHHFKSTKSFNSSSSRSSASRSGSVGGNNNNKMVDNELLSTIIELQDNLKSKVIDIKKFRGNDSPFPSLQVLNGNPITAEEYLLSLNEEIYDTCTNTSNNNNSNGSTHGHTTNGHTNVTKYGNDENGHFNKKSKLKMSYDEFVKCHDEFIDNEEVKTKPKKVNSKNGNNINITFSDVIKNEFYENRKITDSILQTKRNKTSSIDFRPFKEQLLELTPEQIEMKFKRIELRENSSKFRDLLEHKVDDRELFLNKLKQEHEEVMNHHQKKKTGIPTSAGTTTSGTNSTLAIQQQGAQKVDEMTVYLQHKDEARKSSQTHHHHHHHNDSNSSSNGKRNGQQQGNNSSNSGVYMDKFSLGSKYLEELGMIHDHFNEKYNNTMSGSSTIDNHRDGVDSATTNGEGNSSSSHGGNGKKQQQQQFDEATRKEFEELKALKMTRKKYSMEGKKCVIDGKEFVFSNLFV